MSKYRAYIVVAPRPPLTPPPTSVKTLFPVISVGEPILAKKFAGVSAGEKLLKAPPTYSTSVVASYVKA